MNAPDTVFAHRASDDAGTAIERCRLPVSTHFPPDIRNALVAASRTWTDMDAMARVKAIDRAVERARLMHPELFR